MKPFTVFRSYAAPVLFSVTLLLMVLYGITETEKSQRAEGLRTLKEGLLRAAVTCYAIEGRYPPSISYLEEHYGISIDKDHYTVGYNIFSENIMPVITVIDVPR